MKFTNDISFNFKDLIWVISLIIGATWAVAILPQQITADVTTRFASREKVDFMCERMDRLEIKIDKLIELVQYK